VTALTSLFVAAAVAAGAAPQDKMKDTMKAASPDQKFVLEAASGGMMEVQLGQLAVSKATNADVKQFGQRMVDDHSKANEELQGLASSKGITLPTALDAKQQAEVDKLSKMSGADFDHHYMMMMVTDHNKDVAAFERESKNGKDPDVKAWAAKTLPTLQEHQTMAKDIAAKVGHGDMKHGM
jgi:putative membrane protein